MPLSPALTCDAHRLLFVRLLVDFSFCGLRLRIGQLAEENPAGWYQ
jgi:hypothetical protein